MEPVEQCTVVYVIALFAGDLTLSIGAQKWLRLPRVIYLIANVSKANQRGEERMAGVANCRQMCRRYGDPHCAKAPAVRNPPPGNAGIRLTVISTKIYCH
jgi:hypothetical protein